MHPHYLALLLLLPYPLWSQSTDRVTQQTDYHLDITRVQEDIKLDGELLESTWQTANKAGNFWLKWPRDGAPAPQQTEVHCAYDHSYLYIGVTAYDTTPHYVIQSLKRDAEYWDSDGFAVVIDPANAAVNGYFFGTSATGVQTEGLLSTGNDEMDKNWDNTWVVKTHSYPDRWTAEYAIPLRILRFKEGQSIWGINFIRNDLTNGLYSVWAPVPFQFDGADLGWTGALRWDAPPTRTKGNYNIIPYATTSLSKDYEEKGAIKIKPNVGVDAKIGIGSGLNLDLTANPDFSQVEIDEQVVNLTRFDVQLPEKRTFFLENGDLFGNFGIPPIRPFFSRTIGLDSDGSPLPILGGARLTGNLNSDFRIGALTMLTGKQGDTPARQFTALAGNYRPFGRSKIAGYFLDREDFNKGSLLKNQFSRNAGIEMGFRSLNGQWNGWISHHRSFKPGISDKNWWGNLGGQYKTRRFSWLSDLTHVGENYYADMGFEQRLENYDVVRDTTLRIGYNFWFNNLSYQIFPKNKNGILNFILLGAELFNVFNPDGSLNESSNTFTAELNFKNTSEIKAKFGPTWANVPVSFKFDPEEDLEKCPALPAGAYQFTSGNIRWASDYRKRVILAVAMGGGTFYNGKQWQAELELICRFQPIMNVALKAQYNRLDFPAPYCEVELFNIAPRVEVFFAKNLWWTTFLQYNTQSDNFNINSRLQWRYRPMSDLFIVYTDNYAVNVFGVKNRAMTLKLNRWF